MLDEHTYVIHDGHHDSGIGRGVVTIGGIVAGICYDQVKGFLWAAMTTEEGNLAQGSSWSACGVTELPQRHLKHVTPSGACVLNNTR